MWGDEVPVGPAGRQVTAPSHTAPSLDDSPAPEGSASRGQRTQSREGVKWQEDLETGRLTSSLVLTAFA